ncbi:NAD-dependent dehydratase [Subtercola boreus]|uniref:NAD-dependent dehydratase n=1 Tax=Subtercola boreus TaxID=120213 RepID=A0A3E0W3V4_9MICO|nr:SDR family oxidoreductase [Subtercola boreus]RFA16419.1 NAD-dependent dehydratase [Subtercola boreus]
MRIAIAGGHGAIALHLEKLLSDQGHEAVAIIRNPEQASDVLAAGGIPVVIDLEKVDAATLALDLAGVDAVVFAAGAGPNSTAERKNTVDRDGAILLADAAEGAGIRHYVLVSSMGADDFDPESDDVFQIYLAAKAAADANLRERDLDWTIIRPGGLTDEPGTGEVTLAESTGRGTIPRQDVAALIAAALIDGIAVRAQFEAISGDTPIRKALAAVRY